MQDMEVSPAAQMEHQERCYREHFSWGFFLLHSQIWKQDALKSVPGKGDKDSFLQKASSSFPYRFWGNAQSVSIFSGCRLTSLSQWGTTVSNCETLMRVCRNKLPFWGSRPHSFLPLLPRHDTWSTSIEGRCLVYRDTSTKLLQTRNGVTRW